MSPGQSEINKLKELLKRLPQEKNDEKKREAIKKVIAYMTLGIDVSKLFPEMIMLSSTNDIIQKKMIYLYLNNYAESNSELSLLTINTLQKDSKDEDPAVRGLALRSFCNLRISNLLEYIETALFNGLNDKNPYVKRIAITSCIKLLKMNPKISIRNDIIAILKNMLLDRDTQSIVNAIHALNEILIDEGGLKVNKEIIFNILNRLSNFNEWGKCVVLNTISTYIPENEDEMYDIMNILENHIRDFSSAVFLSCLKCFLKFAENDKELQIQIFERMKDPLLTLISTSPYEISYVVLLHTYLLLYESNKLNCKIFDLEYKHFFFRFNDLTYIKMIKLDILVAVASKNNAVSIVNELCEYVSDSNVEISQKAVASVGLIALKIPKATARVVELALSMFLSFNSTYINNATLKILVSILRTHDEYTKIIIETLFKYEITNNIDDEGLISYIWIVGEYCDQIENAPYILEEYVNLQNCSYLFMSELLSACLKVLPKRPAEMKIIVSNLFENILKNYKFPELTDKLLFYHKILSYNYEEAFAIIGCKKKVVKSFCESNENILLDKLYNEFNTLSVVYKKPLDQFTGYSKISFGGIYVQEENKNYIESENDSNCNSNYYDKSYGDGVTASSEFMERNLPLSSSGLSERISVSFNTREHENLLNINEEVLDNNKKKDKATKIGNTYEDTKRENQETSITVPHGSETNNMNFQSVPYGEKNDKDYVTNDSNIDNNYKYDEKKTFENIEDMLIDTINLTPDIYQEKWNVLEETNNEKIFLSKNYKNLTIDSIDELISKYNLTVLASGHIEHSLKFYIYAQLLTKHFVFIELIFNSVEKTINWVLKTTCDNESIIEQFADHFRDIFISFM